MLNNYALYQCSQMGGYLFTQKMKPEYFLPYALHGLNVLTKEGEIRTLKPSDFSDDWGIDFVGMPLLLSIDKMFEEIEHEGETITPIFWIFDKGYKSKKHSFTIKQHYISSSVKTRTGEIVDIESPMDKEVNIIIGNDTYKIFLYIVDLYRYPYTVIQNMIELKLDVFGLIDNGAALDFHKVTQ